jgi:hypothetical protein
MITKDFHYTKDFPLIRGKSFVIMKRVVGAGEHFTQNRRMIGGAAQFAPG